ncbi:MAG TPA: S-methyl-5-thioribose-1-phosphate isomerase [Candidatus Omnitrophota bacterium]|nr:S-methyl-5-thioribose-1-phosphate isomerase [Candidatus Omnitrophota bacterium]
MSVQTLRWKKDALELIDQRLLPGTLKYIKCRTAKDVWDAVKLLKVRGAPAIGVAGAYGLYLGVRNSKAVNAGTFIKECAKMADYISSSRPTAKNLSWGVERIVRRIKQSGAKDVKKLKELVLREAGIILEEDRKVCRDMGKNGAELFKKKVTILTHCNAGALATVDYGTALGVIYSSRKNVKKVFVDETRPVLQGARLTAWELTRNGINATLICDNMAASLMAKGEIDAIIVGADRIAANGDVANKIGTYGVAVLAKYHGIPFYVAAPISTFDISIPSGKYIPIEERSHEEVKKIGDRYITVKNIDVYNPSFDVTPAKLITAIITEKGVIKSPDTKKVRGLLV